MPCVTSRTKDQFTLTMSQKMYGNSQEESRTIFCAEFRLIARTQLLEAQSRLSSITEMAVATNETRNIRYLSKISE